MFHIMKKILPFLGIVVFMGFLTLTDSSKAEASMQVGIMEDTLVEYEPALEAFQKEYPEIPFTIRSISTEDSTEREALLAEAEQGKGIDLFLLNAENPLIPDIIKWAMDGKLQDMEKVLGEKMETLPLHPAAEKAGVFDGKRYFVPLGMTLTGVLTTETWLGENDLTADNTKDFFSEVFADRKLPPKDTLNTGLSNIFCEPLIDYNEYKFALQEEQEEVLTYLLRKQDSVMEMMNPVKLTFLGDANAYYGESFASTWVMEGENPVFLTIPDQNGRNAAVARYAAVRNGSGYQEEAAKLIEWLLEEKWQIESAVLKGTTIIQKAIPVNLSAVEESFFRRIEICMGVTAEGEMKERLEKTAKQMAEEVEKITTLRFCAQENRLIKECVIDEIERGGSVEKALENLKTAAGEYLDAAE